MRNYCKKCINNCYFIFFIVLNIFKMDFNVVVFISFVLFVLEIKGVQNFVYYSFFFQVISIQCDVRLLFVVINGCMIVISESDVYLFMGWFLFSFYYVRIRDGLVDN